MGKDDVKKQKEKVDEVEKVEKVDKDWQEWEDKYKRALADYQNLEKRVAEERKNWIALANKELLLRLLPILDTLMLASAHSQDQGLQVSIRQFLDVLRNEGVTKIETVGKEFD